MFCFWSGPLCGIKNLIFFHLTCYQYSLWINDYQETLTNGHSTESTLIEIYPAIVLFIAFFFTIFYSGLLIKFNILSFVWINIYNSSIVFNFKKKKGFYISFSLKNKNSFYSKKLLLITNHGDSLVLEAVVRWKTSQLEESTGEEENQFKWSFPQCTWTLRTRFF